MIKAISVLLFVAINVFMFASFFLLDGKTNKVSFRTNLMSWLTLFTLFFLGGMQLWNISTVAVVFIALISLLNSAIHDGYEEIYSFKSAVVAWLLLDVLVFLGGFGQ